MIFGKRSLPQVTGSSIAGLVSDFYPPFVIHPADIKDLKIDLRPLINRNSGDRAGQFLKEILSKPVFVVIGFHDFKLAEELHDLPVLVMASRGRNLLGGFMDDHLLVDDLVAHHVLCMEFFPGIKEGDDESPAFEEDKEPFNQDPGIFRLHGFKDVPAKDPVKGGEGIVLEKFRFGRGILYGRIQVIAQEVLHVDFKTF